MDWKRGFFRLWVVLSIAFAGLTLFFMWDDLKSAFVSKNFISHHDVLVVPVTCDGARGKIDTDYTLIKNPWELPWENTQPPEGTIMVTNLCYYELPKFRALYPEYNDLTDKNLLAKTYEKAGIIIPNKSPWKVLAHYLMIAIGIPLVFLIGGRGLSWVYSGFKNN